MSGPAPSPCWTIVGLGNPGPDYALTRHNVGFQVVERLAARHGGLPLHPLGRSLEGTTISLEGRPVALLRPLGYMNRSGPALGPLAASGSLDPERLLVVHDEVDLPLGRLRLKRGGGHGGHNGLRSILETLGAVGFYRLRVGVGRPPDGVAMVDWVLSPFAAEEAETLDAVLERATEAAEALLTWGFAKAASVFNAAPRAAVEHTSRPGPHPSHSVTPPGAAQQAPGDAPEDPPKEDDPAGEP